MWNEPAEDLGGLVEGSPEKRCFDFATTLGWQGKDAAQAERFGDEGNIKVTLYDLKTIAIRFKWDVAAEACDDAIKIIEKFSNG